MKTNAETNKPNAAKNKQTKLTKTENKQTQFTNIFMLLVFILLPQIQMTYIYFPINQSRCSYDNMKSIPILGSYIPQIRTPGC